MPYYYSYLLTYLLTKNWLWKPGSGDGGPQRQREATEARTRAQILARPLNLALDQNRQDPWSYACLERNTVRSPKATLVWGKMQAKLSGMKQHELSAARGLTQKQIVTLIGLFIKTISSQKHQYPIKEPWQREVWNWRWRCKSCRLYVCSPSLRLRVT